MKPIVNQETDSILQALKAFSDRRILVVGDVMMDQFIWGRFPASPRRPRSRR